MKFIKHIFPMTDKKRGIVFVIGKQSDLTDKEIKQIELFQASQWEIEFLENEGDLFNTLNFYKERKRL
jgi:hypothetical protein